MQSEVYSTLWGYKFKKDKKSKANWSIEGSVGRAGLTAGAIGGTITGLDAGNPAVEKFCGALIIDDPQKAGDEIYETKRDLVVDSYDKKLTTRLRRSDVPTIIIMQRLHEEDLSGYIRNEGKYGKDLKDEEKQKWLEEWDDITIKALEDEKSIWEEKVSTAKLLDERDRKPWVFYPQRQQETNVSINTKFKGLTISENTTLIYNSIAVLDKSFGGKDGTAFAAARIAEINGQRKIIMFGKLWQKHVDDCIDDIKMFRNQLRIGSIYTEDNDDKGYTAKNNKFIAYHEKMNKNSKIMTYLYENWKDIIFIKGRSIAWNLK